MNFQMQPIKAVEHQSDSDGLDEIGISSLVSRGFSRDQAIKMISSSNSSGSNVKQITRQTQVYILF
jgi:hypothetical protein